MVTKLRFENNTGELLNICVEPLAEYIDWEIGKPVEIELKLATEKYNDELSFALTKESLVIYEGRQYEMRILVGNDLKYSTPPGRYF